MVMSSHPPTELELPKSWTDFAAKPNEETARALADALKKMDADESRARLVMLIAEMLARRAAVERSKMTRLIESHLTDYKLGLGFLQATAAVRLVPPKPAPQPAPHDRLAESLDLLSPKPLEPQLARTPGGRDRLGLEGLDLATTGKVEVDLLALEKRTDEVSEWSSMSYLLEALDLVNSIYRRADSYSKVRRAELGDLVRGTTHEHLAEQMGFRTAMSQRPTEKGLVAQNELAVSYWRTNFRGTLQRFMEKVRSSWKPGDVLVNSPRVLQKLALVVRPEVLKDLEITPVVEGSGVCVLSGTEKHDTIRWDQILQELGAAPSAYALYELMDVHKAPPQIDYEVDAWADLAELISSSPFSRLQERAAGTSRLAPVCAMVEHVVLGLAAGLGPERHDPLTANALGSLSELLDIVVTNHDNPSVALRAVDLMMDEIGIVVAASRLFHPTDYEQIMRKVLLDRAPSLTTLVDEAIQIDSHLMTSGMDAIGTALSISLSARGHGQASRTTEGIDYFETNALLETMLDNLKKGGVVNARDDVMIAALNPSTPFEAPRIGTLLDDVKKRLQAAKGAHAPFALVLDTTIEVHPASSGGRSQLDVLLDGLKEFIAAGELQVFLCKSFQKYASFGTGKVAAADLTLLSTKKAFGSASAQYEAMLHDLDLDLARHDEGQLVVHMLTYGHKDELALVRSAAGNAQFIDDYCWPIDHTKKTLGSKYVDGVPLLLRSTPDRVDKLFEHLMVIDRRDSFSFLRTSFVAIDFTTDPRYGNHFVRINPGHEPKRSMVEYFYAIGHLTSGTLPGAKTLSDTPPASVSSLKMEDVNKHLEALAGITDDTDPQIALYRANIEASYLILALLSVRPKGSVWKRLTAFFAKPLGSVSIETQRHLARELLLLANSNASTADLAVLVRAAELLPAWLLEPIATEWKLDRLFGNAKLAHRLLTLVERAKKTG
jgi:hypothetical protein